jgi:hypothetical protein
MQFERSGFDLQGKIMKSAGIRALEEVRRETEGQGEGKRIEVRGERSEEPGTGITDYGFWGNEP